MSFSNRMGYAEQRDIQIESIDVKLRNRLDNYFNCRLSRFSDYGMTVYTLDKMGKRLNSVSDERSLLSDMITNDNEWYIPYDIIEYNLEYIYSSIAPYDVIAKENYSMLVKELNSILVEEKSGYRMVDGQFVPITDENELEEIQKAMHSEFDAVDKHIKKALILYSDRDNPDYENSIKESISAVESMCCIITNQKGASATLGAAIKKLEENGVVIHQAMKSAYSQLYGFTSDQDGIRHGGIDFKNAPEEDARYMLISCSAFINYLKDKYAKSQNGNNLSLNC